MSASALHNRCIALSVEPWRSGSGMSSNCGETVMALGLWMKWFTTVKCSTTAPGLVKKLRSPCFNVHNARIASSLAEPSRARRSATCRSEGRRCAGLPVYGSRYA